MDIISKSHIVLTGASEGIGAALAKYLSRAGANLILVARSQDKLLALAKTLGEKPHHPGQSFSVMPCDLSQPKQVQDLIAALQKLPKLDGIIHNAGVGLYEDLIKTPESEIRRLFEINFFSIEAINRALLPKLKQSTNGRLVFLSSVVGWRGIPQLSYYCASKGAINLYAESLRTELAHTAIKVINIYPGRTRTNFSTNAYATGWRPFSTEHGGTHVDKVAKKIVRAYQKGKRDELILVSNRLLIWMNFFFPKLVDWVLAKWIRAEKKQR